MFNPVSTSIHDILNSTTQFAIPLYQRDYKWGEEEATELIEDLRNYDDTTKEGLFLGNIIVEKSKDQNTLVVDGQQRLTTILLLLVATASAMRWNVSMRTIVIFIKHPRTSGKPPRH